MQRRTLQERSYPVGEPLEILGAAIADTPDRPRRLLRHDSPPGAVVMQLAVREEWLEVRLFRVRLRAQLAPPPRGGQIVTGEDPDLDFLDRVLAEQRLPLLEVLRALPFQEGQRLSPAAMLLAVAVNDQTISSNHPEASRSARSWEAMMRAASGISSKRVIRADDSPSSR